MLRGDISEGGPVIEPTVFEVSAVSPIDWRTKGAVTAVKN
jgi:hypothetical protein